MKKIFLFIIIGTYCSAAYSQTGKGRVGLGGTIGIPTGDFGEAAHVGFGGYAKAMVSVNNSGEVSLTTGITSFRVKYIPTGASAYYTIIPILVGYRHNIAGFYFEPQIGVGIYGAKATYNGQSSSDSKSAFTFGAGVGYEFASNFDIGLSYRYGKIKDADAPFTVFGIHIGYNIPLKSQATKGK
jgi:opacity protein-like surface antigen